MNSYPWHKIPWQQLSSAYKQNRLPHALLLTGPLGLGKREFAQQFAQYLLCEQINSEQDKPCDYCSSCQLMLAHSHPDFLLLLPEEKSTAIKIDQIRKLTGMLNQTSQRGGYQVIILYPAEALNKAAANALLKTLEEPEGKVLLLLVNHQIGMLPATIVSRCQQVILAGKNDAATISWVADHLDACTNAISKAQLLLRMTDYAPLRAVILAKTGYFALRDQLLEHLHLFVTSSSTVNSLQWVSDYLKQEISIWIDTLVFLIMDMIRIQLGSAPHLLVNTDKFAFLVQISQGYLRINLLKLLEKLIQARQWLLSNANLNKQLLLENLLIHLERASNATN